MERNFEMTPTQHTITALRREFETELFE
ncbi:MAG: hypothetical protein RI932_1652, partial [Pseudomonadota bacterium]